MLVSLLATLVTKILWFGMLILFFAGGVAYAFDPQAGRLLLKRSLVMMVMLLLIRAVP